MDPKTEMVERKIVPFTPAKNPYKERLLLIAVGKYMLEAYEEREDGKYNFRIKYNDRINLKFSINCITCK